jgi:hypothetical protein
MQEPQRKDVVTLDVRAALPLLDAGEASKERREVKARKGQECLRQPFLFPPRRL